MTDLEANPFGPWLGLRKVATAFALGVAGVRGGRQGVRLRQYARCEEPTNACAPAPPGVHQQEW